MFEVVGLRLVPVTAGLHGQRLYRHAWCFQVGDAWLDCPTGLDKDYCYRILQCMAAATFLREPKEMLVTVCWVDAQAYCLCCFCSPTRPIELPDGRPVHSYPWTAGTMMKLYEQLFVQGRLL